MWASSVAAFPRGRFHSNRTLGLTIAYCPGVLRKGWIATGRGAGPLRSGHELATLMAMPMVQVWIVRVAVD